MPASRGVEFAAALPTLCSFSPSDLALASGTRERPSQFFRRRGLSPFHDYLARTALFPNSGWPWISGTDTAGHIHFRTDLLTACYQ